MATAALSLGVSAQAQEFLVEEFKVPDNYYSRFATASVLGSSESEIGIRNIPLPFEPDIRFSVVENQKYWEYNASLQQGDTNIAFGVFSNGYKADYGIPKFEVSHAPWKGWQGNIMTQHLAEPLFAASGLDTFSKVSVGYAITSWEERIRILNNVGIGYKTIVDDKTLKKTSEIVIPYTETVASISYSYPLGNELTASVYSAARLYIYPIQQKIHANLAIQPSLEWRPAGGLTLGLSHLAIFASSPGPITDLNVDQKGYQESYATLSYRLPENNDLGLGMLRAKVTQNWITETTSIRGDMLFPFQGLPVLLGPSIGYEFSPNGNSNRFLFGLAVGMK